ncbi:NUDIX hydrolase [Emticicia sp. SJ17W-69]|uniref:NUDIX hydrolase n=1 Tax=Emticicia sp. SJ17W-69 TaxID=3421657 RepID=UPI003EB81161
MSNILKNILERSLKEVSIDFVIFGFNGGELKVLLLKWKNTDKWSLPGGRIFPDENLNDAAVRILVERTGLKNHFLQQFHTFGDVIRNKNYSKSETYKYLETAFGGSFKTGESLGRVISVGYYALLDFEKVTAVPDLVTDECKWYQISELPLMLFDHNEMVEKALKTLRKDIRFMPISNLLPEKFTISEIQKLYETILNKQFDRRNFHKSLVSQDFLIKLDEKRIGNANKAPHLFKFDTQKYLVALENGIDL